MTHDELIECKNHLEYMLNEVELTKTVRERVTKDYIDILAKIKDKK